MNARRTEQVVRSSGGPLLMFTLAILSGCGGLEITSRWRTGDVAINGEHTGWFAQAVPLSDNHTSVVAMNDGEFLFVGLRTTNRDLQRQVMREGITWWFDREGGDQKRFGIHYPVGGGYNPGMPSEEDGTPEEGTEGVRDMQQLNTGDLDIYAGGEGQARRMTKMATGGIDARVHRSKDTLYYELQVPLKDNGPHPFAIGAQPGTRIGVGMETAMRKGPEGLRGGTSERGGNPPGGGGGVGGRGGGGRGRGGARPARQETGTPPAQIRTWAKIQLAGESAASK
jgi:hypothetical protein